MISSQISSASRVVAIQRLTALWALSECGLGGFLHAIQSSFTGLLVGSIAMVCIAFICSLSDNKWQTVMTSLAIVLVIKALVSPHSPPTAYIAVLFQAVTGALIYRFVPGLLFGSLLFLILGLIESAVQRLLVLVILYGNTIWKAINTWGEWVTREWGLILPFSSSQLIIFTYLGIHFIAGIGLGVFTYKIINAVNEHWGEGQFQIQLTSEDKKNFLPSKSGNKQKWKSYLFFLGLALIIILAYFLPDNKLPIENGIIAILRAIAILTIWYFFLAPFVIRLLRKWLLKKNEQLAEQISMTMDMFPHLLWIIDKSWKETKDLRLFGRWKAFILNSFLYILQYTSPHDSDPDRSGPKS